MTTSVDLFQAKLSNAAIRRLSRQLFEVDSFDINEMFRLALDYDCIYLSASLSRQIIDRQRDYIQSPHALIKALQVENVIL